MGTNVNELLDCIEISSEYLNRLSFPEPALLASFRQPRKSNIESAACRNVGNIKYKEGRNNHEALEWYTKSVAWATEGSRELALAYGNRSSVLLRLRMYEACLLDVNRALKCDCPEESKAKLLPRKEKCVAALASRSRAINDDQTEPVESSTKAVDKLPALNENPLLPNTSSKIKLAYNRKWGTHMVAAKDIEPGEILSVEEFFAASLNAGQQSTHCSYCFAKCEALIGCLSCSKTMYCSSKCRSRAYNAYHRVECEMWPFYEEERLDAFDIAAIRALLVGTEQGAKLSDLTNRAGHIFNGKMDLVNKRFKNNYSTILKLHWATAGVPKVFVLLAVKVIIILDRLSLFFKNSNRNADLMNRSKLFATITLIKHLTSISSFSFVVSDVTPSKNKSSGREHVIGLGACALHNLVNHSCNPNVADVIGKRKHIYFSVRPISRGQQIFFSYGGISFAKNTLEERREKLLPFGLSCCCRACVDVWPKYSQLQRLNPRFMNTNRRVIASIMSMEKKMTNADEHFDDNCTVETLQNLVRYSKTICQNVNAPSALIVQCEELIVRGMRKSFGNFYNEYRTATEGKNKVRDDKTDSEEENSYEDLFFDYTFRSGKKMFM